MFNSYQFIESVTVASEKHIRRNSWTLSDAGWNFWKGVVSYAARYSGPSSNFTHIYDFRAEKNLPKLQPHRPRPGETVGRLQTCRKCMFLLSYWGILDQILCCIDIFIFLWSVISLFPNIFEQKKMLPSQHRVLYQQHLLLHPLSPNLKCLRQ